MTTTLKVNKEAIRILVADVGYTEAANRTGIDRNTLYQWARRFSWNAPIPHAQDTVRTVRRPSDAHTEALAAHEGITRLTLAKYASNAATAIHRSVHPAKWTKEAKDLASVMATVHRQDQDKGTAQFSLNVLNLNMFSDTDTPTLDA